MSAPTSIREVLDRITAKQHEYRVVEHLVECLRPFVDMDVGRRRVLESEGCLVPFVPQEVVIGKIRWLAKEMEAIQSAVDELQNTAMAPPIPPAALVLPEPAQPLVTAMPNTRAVRRAKTVTPAPTTPEPAPKKGKKRNEDPVRPAVDTTPVGPEPRKRRTRPAAA